MEYFSLFDVKFKNRQNIFHYIYKYPDCTKQTIAAALNLSLPTVSQHLKFFLDHHLISISGHLPSAVGRRAASYRVIANAKISIGVEILPSKCYITALDLCGNRLAKEKRPLTYAPTKAYFSALKDAIYQFIENNCFSQEALLGIGIGVQGIVSPDGKEITYGEIIQSTGLSIDLIQEYFSCPCCFLHDSEAAMLSELFEEEHIHDMTYIFLGPHLGGTVFLNKEIRKGSTGKMGTFEHMTLVPNGRPCYCGQMGCAECYCSLESLLDPGETDWEVFFAKKEAKDPASIAKWNTYLDYLAILIHNLYMVFESNILLGGHAVFYFNEADLARLQKDVARRTPFRDSIPKITLGKCWEDAISVGAALFFIKQFLGSSFHETERRKPV